MVTSIESPSSLEPERPTTVPAHFPATIWKLVMGTVVAGGGGAEVQPAIVAASTTIRRPSMRIEALLAVCRPPPRADRQGEMVARPGANRIPDPCSSGGRCSLHPSYGRIAGLSLFGGNPATFECTA